MVNYAVFFSAVFWLVAALVPDHPRHADGQAFCFIMGAASFCLAVIFELVRIVGG